MAVNEPEHNIYRIGQACPFGNGNFYGNGTRWIQKMEDRVMLIEEQVKKLDAIDKKINAFIGGVSLLVGGVSFIFLVLRMAALLKDFAHG